MEDILAGEVDGCINVHSKSRDPRARLLSALANRPFKIYGQWFSSLEGLHQGIKFPLDDRNRYAAFASSFGYAQEFGKLALERKLVWWSSETIPYNSLRHIQVLEQGFRESFSQCPERMDALCQTEGLTILHEIESGGTDPVMPASRFCEFLTKIRAAELSRRLALR